MKDWGTILIVICTIICLGCTALTYVALGLIQKAVRDFRVLLDDDSDEPKQQFAEVPIPGGIDKPSSGSVLE